jgi:hypothetical protein
MVLQHLQTAFVKSRKLISEHLLRTQLPAIVVHGQPARIPKSNAFELFLDIACLKCCPVLIQILVRYIMRIGSKQFVDQLNCEWLVVKKRNISFPQSLDFFQREGDTLKAVSLHLLREMPQQGSHRQETGPPGHTVVGHFNESTWLEVPTNQFQHATPQFGAYPAKDSMKYDEIELSYVRRECGEVGADHPEIINAARGRFTSDVVCVNRHEIDAGELALWIGGGEGQQGAPEPTA